MLCMRAEATQKCFRGMSVHAAFHLVKGLVLGFVVPAAETYCGGCPRGPVSECGWPQCSCILLGLHEPRALLALA